MTVQKMTVQDILKKDLVGNDTLTVDELRFLMSVTDEDDLQVFIKRPMKLRLNM